jgi:heme exporter protein B
MPLYIPVVIFGTGAINAAILNLDWVAHIYLLGAMLVLSLCLAPFAAAAALRISLN